MIKNLQSLPKRDAPITISCRRTTSTLTYNHILCQTVRGMRKVFIFLLPDFVAIGNNCIELMLSTLVITVCVHVLTSGVCRYWTC